MPTKKKGTPGRSLGKGRGTGAGRLTKLTPLVREKFFKQLQVTPNVTLACRIAGFSKEFAYELRKADPEFARQWQEAIDYGLALVEQEVRRRGTEGYISRVRYDVVTGRPIAMERTYSDKLALAYLTAHDSRYRNKHEISGPGGGPVPLTLADLAKMARDKETEQ